MDAQGYFILLVDSILGSYTSAGRFAVEVDVNGISLEFGYALDLGLIVTEIVSTICKQKPHDDTDSWAIELKLDRNEQGYELTVNIEGRTIDAGIRAPAGLAKDFIDALSSKLNGNYTIGGGREPFFLFFCPDPREK